MRFACIFFIMLLSTPTYADTFVATRTLKKGDVISLSDITKSHTDGSPPREKMDTIIGNEVRRVIYKGSPIRAIDTGPITIIDRNEVIVMTFKLKSMELKTKGRALDAGGIGEFSASSGR